MDEPKTMFTMAEVRKHRSKDDCWVVIHGKVYDVTKYLKWHPGGTEILLMNCGRDATYSFKLNHHGDGALTIMKKYCVGKICEKPEEKAQNPHGTDEGRAPKRKRDY